MTTDKSTPEARMALARCYRLLLRLARQKEEHDVALDGSATSAKPESCVEVETIPGLETTNVTNETA